MVLLNGAAAVEQWVSFQTHQRTRQPVPYGVPICDRSIGNHVAGTMEVIGARTNVGKSFILLEKARSLAEAGHRPLIISCEDTVEELGRRLSHLPESTTNNILTSFPQYARLSEIIGCIVEGAQQGVSCVMLDYLQVLKYDGELQIWSRHDELSTIMRELGTVSRLHGLPITVTSQLRRPSTDQVDRPPSLYDLKESGDIENLSYSVVLMHATSPLEVLVWLAKNKGGPCGARMTYTRGDGGLLRPAEGLVL